MERGNAYLISVAGAVVVTIALTCARVVEVTAGHAPTPALTAAFSASVTATLALLAVGRALKL